MTTFVAIAVQGTVLDAKAIAVGQSETDLQSLADSYVSALNAKQQGESEGYAAVVVPVEGTDAQH